MDRSLLAVEMLVKGKTDTELLEAVVSALTDNGEDLLGKLDAQRNYDTRTAGNLLVVASIVRTVKEREEVVVNAVEPDQELAREQKSRRDGWGGK